MERNVLYITEQPVMDIIIVPLLEKALEHVTNVIVQIINYLQDIGHVVIFGHREEIHNDVLQTENVRYVQNPVKVDRRKSLLGVNLV
jgi:hypothetical protein